MSFISLKHVLQARRLYQVGFFALLTAITALSLLLANSPIASASTVTISDPQHVLNTSQVQSEGQNLPYPLDIYVTKNFSGTRSDFDQRVKQHITTPTKIVMAIDTGHKYLAIAGGTSVPLSNSQYQDAVNAFSSSFGSGDYTGATIASIQSLESSLSSQSNSNNGNSNSSQPVNSSNGGIAGNLLGTLCCVGLVILAIVGALFFVFRRRGFGGMRRNVPPYQQPMQPVPPYDQYNQGYPPGYGPGYPGYPNYNQRQGMNPWAAGGIGAAAGGLLGYELGKEQGEDQAREQQGMNSGNLNNGGDFGGGAGGSFGGNDNGGFGGGAGGDFGGGDWGGGGGNDWGSGGGDAGGGAGGNF